MNFKVDFFVCFLEELKIPKRHFKINWPLTAKAYHCALELKLFCYCAKWKKSLKRGLLVEQYLVVKVAAQRFMLFGFFMHNWVRLFLKEDSYIPAWFQLSKSKIQKWTLKPKNIWLKIAHFSTNHMKGLQSSLVIRWNRCNFLSNTFWIRI